MCAQQVLLGKGSACPWRWADGAAGTVMPRSPGQLALVQDLTHLPLPASPRDFWGSPGALPPAQDTAHPHPPALSLRRKSLPTCHLIFQVIPRVWSLFPRLRTDSLHSICGPQTQFDGWHGVSKPFEAASIRRGIPDLKKPYCEDIFKNQTMHTWFLLGHEGLELSSQHPIGSPTTIST